MPWIQDSLFVELGFRIAIVSWIPDSLSCFADSKAQDSGLHKQNFPRFQIPQAKISGILISRAELFQGGLR